MKILEIIPQLSSGGGERFVVDLCNELSKEHDVTLMVLHSLDKVDFYLKEVSNNVRVVSMNKRMGLDIGLLFRVYRYIRREKPDVVHTHLRAIMYIAFAIMRKHGVMHCHTVHNAADKEAGGSFISSGMRKFCFHHGWITPITISAESLHSFRKYYGMDAPMIFNGRNVDAGMLVSDEVKEQFKQYRHTNKTRVLISLARIDPVKRQTLLARVVMRLKREGYDLTVLFIGGERDAQMTAELRSYNDEAIQLLGELHNPLEYLKMGDAYALCSSYEGMPISLIEAIGVGCIPVCTPVGGIVDVVHNGENGFLSDGIGEESYYKTVKRFLSLTDVQLKDMKQKALATYGPFSMYECARNYVRLFEKGIKK